MTPDQKLEQWFVAPIAMLKAGRTENADGAFIALCTSLVLFERFIHASLKQSNIKATPEEVQRFGAANLGISEEDFNKFWGMFRHGTSHSFQPKRFTSKGVRYGWEISDSYNAIPHLEKRGDDLIVIKLDPWKFAEMVGQRFRDDIALFDLHEHNKLGDCPPPIDPSTLLLGSETFCDDDVSDDAAGLSDLPASTGNFPDVY